VTLWGNTSDWSDTSDVGDGGKALYALITVSLGDTVIETGHYAETVVPDGCAMTVFHLAHGG
jgi:hypothetical protein